MNFSRSPPIPTSKHSTRYISDGWANDKIWNKREANTDLEKRGKALHGKENTRSRVAFINDTLNSAHARPHTHNTPPLGTTFKGNGPSLLRGRLARSHRGLRQPNHRPKKSTALTVDTTASSRRHQATPDTSASIRNNISLHIYPQWNTTVLPLFFTRTRGPRNDTQNDKKYIPHRQHLCHYLIFFFPPRRREGKKKQNKKQTSPLSYRRQAQLNNLHS